MICPERIDATVKALTDTYWLCLFLTQLDKLLGEDALGSPVAQKSVMVGGGVFFDTRSVILDRTGGSRADGRAGSAALRASAR